MTLYVLLIIDCEFFLLIRESGLEPHWDGLERAQENRCQGSSTNQARAAGLYFPILEYPDDSGEVRDIHWSRFQSCGGVYSHERKCNGRRPWETLQREIERQEYRILSGQVSGSRHPEESGQLCKPVNCESCELWTMRTMIFNNCVYFLNRVQSTTFFWITWTLYFICMFSVNIFNDVVFE